MRKGQGFIFTTFVVIYLTVLLDLDGDQSLSYFLHGVPEWQSGHTTRKQDGSVEWGVTSFMTVQLVQLGTGLICILLWFILLKMHRCNTAFRLRVNTSFCDCTDCCSLPWHEAFLTFLYKMFQYLGRLSYCANYRVGPLFKFKEINNIVGTNQPVFLQGVKVSVKNESWPSLIYIYNALDPN